jgi:hypothetical protein
MTTKELILNGIPARLIEYTFEEFEEYWNKCEDERILKEREILAEMYEDLEREGYYEN